MGIPEETATMEAIDDETPTTKAIKDGNTRRHDDGRHNRISIGDENTRSHASEMETAYHLR
ncbi:hypothetical protein OROMI_026397 [Orobanche minor]